MNINDLPEDCLLSIFAQFPSINDLLQFRCICSRWFAIVELHCRKKKCLKLFGSHDNAQCYQKTLIEKYNLKDRVEGDVVVESETVQLIVGCNAKWKDNVTVCHFLSSLLPNVTNLIIYCLHLVPIDLPHLLQHWPCLNSLTLFGMSNLSSSEGQIWTSISQLHSLKRLHLFGMHNCTIPTESISPILSQLTHFSLSDYYTGNVIRVLASLKSTTHLLLEWIRCLWDDFQSAVLSVSSVATHLTLGEFYATEDDFDTLDTVDVLPFICGHFSGLIYLDLKFVLELPMVYLVQDLSRLVHLNELRIFIRSGALDNFNHIRPPALHSITTLQLNRLCICLIREHPTANANRLALGQVFPSVQSITVQSHCFRCLSHIGQFCLDEQLPQLRQCRVASLP